MVIHTAFRHEHVYGGGLSVASAARIVPGILERGATHSQPGLRARTRLRLHGDPAARSVVVDHAIVVVPEHVLRRRWTLERDGIFFIAYVIVNI